MRSADSLTPSYPANASGDYSISLGRRASAAGLNSIAFGNWTQSVTGQNALGIGTDTQSTGISSTAISSSARANANGATSIGASCITRSPNAVIIGSSSSSWNTVSGNSLIMGYASALSNAAAASGSIILGSYNTVPSGFQCNDMIVMGSSTSLTGTGVNNTILMGLVASADSAEDAVGIGRQCSITGNSATTIGRNSSASENKCFYRCIR